MTEYENFLVESLKATEVENYGSVTKLKTINEFRKRILLKLIRIEELRLVSV